MVNERTAPAALRRAEALRDRLRTLADPPVAPARDVGLLRGASQPRGRGARAGGAGAGVRAVSAPARHLQCPDHRAHARRVLRRAAAAVRGSARSRARRGAMQEMVGISAVRASASCDCGALADAEADARWALERAEGVRRMHAVSEMIRVLIERDELEAAEDVLEQFADPRASRSVRRGSVSDRAGSAAWRAGPAAGGARRPPGVRTAMRAARALDAERLAVAREAALIYAALGNTEEARRLAGEQLELARAFGRPRTLGISLRACGLVEGGERRPGAACRGGHDPGALAVPARARPRAHRPRRCAASRRRRVQARTELERALDLAHRLGARRIANQARAELIAAGAKTTARRDHRPRCADRRRAARRETRRRRARRNRAIAPGAVHHHQDRQSPSQPRLPQARQITRRGQLANALTGQLDDGHKHPLIATRRFPKTSRGKRRDLPGRCATHPAGRHSLP